MFVAPSAAVDSAPAQEVLEVVTSLKRKFDDFVHGLSGCGLKVVNVKPVKIVELATNNSKELLEHKKTTFQKILGKPRVPTLYEDTSFGFLKDGKRIDYPTFDITRLCPIKPLIEWANFLGCPEAEYTCSAILEVPDCDSFFFSVTRHVTMCERRPGEGAIDPFTIPDGSDKAFSEMSEEDRAILHARGELARLIAAKLQELGY